MSFCEGKVLENSGVLSDDWKLILPIISRCNPIRILCVAGAFSGIRDFILNYTFTIYYRWLLFLQQHYFFLSMYLFLQCVCSRSLIKLQLYQYGMGVEDIEASLQNSSRALVNGDRKHINFVQIQLSFKPVKFIKELKTFCATNVDWEVL